MLLQERICMKTHPPLKTFQKVVRSLTPFGQILEEI
jgi:hypothetical protein